MNTEETPLLGDISEAQMQLENLFKESANKKQLILESHENSTKAITGQQNNLLQGLGFDALENITEFRENKAILEKAGLTMETINQLREIKTTYKKNIIGYNALCTLCTKHNLYFGSSKLFTGKMPMENVKELEEFPFARFSSHYSVLESYGRQSIVKGSVSASSKVLIVAPLSMFKLEDTLVSSSRELISFKGHSARAKKRCSNDDPIVLLPFRASASKEIFFVIVTHWDNSKSII